MWTQHTFKATIICIAICVTLVDGGPVRKNSDDEKQNHNKSVDVNISIQEMKETTDSVTKIGEHESFLLSGLIVFTLEFVPLFCLIICLVLVMHMCEKEEAKLRKKMSEDAIKVSEDAIKNQTGLF